MLPATCFGQDSIASHMRGQILAVAVTAYPAISETFVFWHHTIGKGFMLAPTWKLNIAKNSICAPTYFLLSAPKLRAPHLYDIACTVLSVKHSISVSYVWCLCWHCCWTSTPLYICKTLPSSMRRLWKALVHYRTTFVILKHLKIAFTRIFLGFFIIWHL